MDRNVVKKYREERRKCSIEMWQNFGGIMNLDRQKFDQTYIFEKVEPIQAKIMEELILKNTHNHRITKKYIKKVNTQPNI